MILIVEQLYIPFGIDDVLYCINSFIKFPVNSVEDIIDNDSKPGLQKISNISFNLNISQLYLMLGRTSTNWLKQSGPLQSRIGTPSIFKNIELGFERSFQKIASETVMNMRKNMTAFMIVVVVRNFRNFSRATSVVSRDLFFHTHCRSTCWNAPPRSRGCLYIIFTS